MTDEIILWDYYRSSASYRVRIALNLAGVHYTKMPIDLLAAEHKTEEHMSRNPQGLVPVLDIDGMRLTQSLAMLEYLDETRELGLLPEDAKDGGAAHARGARRAAEREVQSKAPQERVP